MNTIINKGRKHSEAYGLNLLLNEEKIFIMDNHLAAGWCWLKKLDIERQYNLFHIDRHYDLLKSQLEWWIESLNQQNVNLQAISIEELVSLRYSNERLPTNDSYPIFRWDNYIPILDRMYPYLIGHSTFATHKDGDNADDMEASEVDPWQLPDNLSYWLTNGTNEWILNLDIDYFFTNIDEEYIQLFTDEFVIQIAKEIKKSLSKIKVLTIALSPEMCGGWDKSERVARLITDELGLKWTI